MLNASVSIQRSTWDVPTQLHQSFFTEVIFHYVCLMEEFVSITYIYFVFAWLLDLCIQVATGLVDNPTNMTNLSLGETKPDQSILSKCMARDIVNVDS